MNGGALPCSAVACEREREHGFDPTGQQQEEFAVVTSIKDEVFFPHKLNYWDKKIYIGA